MTPLGPPAAYPVVLRISRPDVAHLKTLGDEAAAQVSGHPEAREVHTDWGERAPAVQVTVDPDRALALGLSSAAVIRALGTAVSGLTLGQWRERDPLIDIVLRAPADERVARSRHAQLQVPLARGCTVPLLQVAEARDVMEEPIIRPYSRMPTLSVRADLAPGVQAPDAMARMLPGLRGLQATLPDGYRIEAGGPYEENAMAQGSIGAGVPLMLFAWLAMLILQQRSFSLAAMVPITAPFGLAGVAVGLLGARLPFGFVAMLSMIALVGIVLRNTVILIDQIRQDREAGVAAWNAAVTDVSSGHALLRLAGPSAR